MLATLILPCCRLLLDAAAVALDAVVTAFSLRRHTLSAKRAVTLYYMNTRDEKDERERAQQDTVYWRERPRCHTMLRLFFRRLLLEYVMRPRLSRQDIALHER